MMWITFSLFLCYSYVYTSVQCENCFYNEKSFLAIPNMLEFHWTKVAWAPSTLQQHTTGVTTATTATTATITTTMAAASGNCPLAPHMRPCTLCQRIKWMGNYPPSKQIYFLVVLRVCMALKHSNVVAMHHCRNKGVFLGPYTPSTPKIISACLGGCRPSI
jgi:hypothetical protein